MKRLLPLGTIVKVDLGKKNTASLMIAGYYPKNNDTGEVYDYLTVMYPFGMCYKEAVQMIKSPSILKVEAMGYMDETAEVFTKELPKFMEDVKNTVQDVIEQELQKEEKNRVNQEFG